MDRDRNLLFGVLAVQLGRIGPEQLVEVAGAWATDPSQDLWDRLTASGALSQQDCRMLLEFVEQAVKAHGGDATATLAAFGGIEQVHHSFQGTLTMSPEGHLVTVTTPPPEGGTADVTSIQTVTETPGRYTYLREHGRGGMGRVLLVHDAHLGRDIALKELLPGPADADGQPSPVRRSVPHLARFLAEACITSQLEHPSIVPVYELGRRTDGTLYYTMKLVRGRTLQQRIREAGSLSERLKLLPHFVDLCQAIAYAHSRNVIHRDIKPGNVMVGEFGETVVLDWGVAKVKNQEDVHAAGIAETLHLVRDGSEGDAAKTEYGQIVGTPCYMSPEQAKGDLSAVDECSDVYSLGTVLYELLTGHPPHEGGSAREVVEKVVAGLPVSVRTIELQAPAELIAICERAMRPAPGERYKSAKELAEEVERFQSGALVQAYQYGFSEYAAKLVKRHKSLAISLAAMLLTVLGLSAYYVVEINRANVGLESALTHEEALRGTAEKAQKNAEAATRRQEEESYIGSIRLAQQFIEAGQFMEARKVIWGIPEHLRNWEWGYLCIQANLADVSLFTDMEGITGKLASPDGKYFMTRGTVQKELLDSSPDCVQVRRTDNGEIVKVLYSEGSNIDSAEFSADGKIILTFSRNGLVRLWDSSTGLIKDEFSIDESFDSAHLGTAMRNLLAVDGESGFSVYRIENRAKLLAKDFDLDKILDVEMDTNESRVVVALSDRIEIYDLTSQKLLKSEKCSFEHRDKVKLSSDGRLVLTISKDNVEVKEIETGKTVFEYNSEPEKYKGKLYFSVVDADLNSSSKQIVLVSLDGRAAIFNLEFYINDSEVYHITHSFSVNKNTKEIAFGQDDRRIIQLTHSGDYVNGRILSLWNSEYLSNVSPNKMGAVSSSEMCVVALTDQGSFLISNSGKNAGKISLSNLDKDQLLLTKESGYEMIREATNDSIDDLETLHYYLLASDVNAKISGSGSLMAVRNVAGIDVFAVPSGRLCLGLRPQKIGLDMHFSFIPGKDLLLCWSKERGGSIWDVRKGICQCRLVGLRDIGRPIDPSFTRDGKKMVGISSWGTTIWDVLTGVPILTVEDDGKGISTIAISPDGRLLARGSIDGTLCVFDPWTTENLVEVIAHQGPISCLTFTNDGTRILSASLDGTICVWHSNTGERLLTISNQSTMVPISVACSPDSRRIAIFDVMGGPFILDAAPWPSLPEVSHSAVWSELLRVWEERKPFERQVYNYLMEAFVEMWAAIAAYPSF